MKDRVIEVVCQEPGVAYRARWTAATAFSPACMTLEKTINNGVWYAVLSRLLPTDEKDECIRLRREVAWLRDAGNGDWPVEFMAEDIVGFIQIRLRRQPPKDWQPLKEPV